MYEYDVHYTDELGAPVKHAPRMFSEEQLLDWIKETGMKVFFFDVFRFER